MELESRRRLDKADSVVLNDIPESEDLVDVSQSTRKEFLQNSREQNTNPSDAEDEQSIPSPSLDSEESTAEVTPPLSLSPLEATTTSIQYASVEPAVDSAMELEVRNRLDNAESVVLCDRPDLYSAPRNVTVVHNVGHLTVGNVTHNTIVHTGTEESDELHADTPMGNRLMEDREWLAVKRKSDEFVAICQSKTRDLFVETSRYHAAKNVIENKKSLLLHGGSGDGKSAILYYLSANHLEGYLPISVSSPSKIQEYVDKARGTNMQLLFINDEPLGASYVQQRLLEDWINIGKDLEMYLGMHKFVFATRTSVWKDCMGHFHGSPFFNNIVEVTSASLTQGDKRELILHYLGDTKSLTDTEIDDIVSNDKPIAYSQCCKLMSDAIGQEKRGHVRTSLINIFQRPFSFLGSELSRIAEMEKEKYATLCLIMLCGGKIGCNQLAGTLRETTAEVRHRMDAVLDACDCPSKTCGAFQNCAEKLVGTYLEIMAETVAGSYTVNVYKFSHGSLHEAVIMLYGKRHFLHCLKFLPIGVIVKITRPEEYPTCEQEFALNLPFEYYEAVAGAFTTKVICDNRSLQDVFDSPLVGNIRFQEVWIKYLRSSPDHLKAFIRSKYQRHDQSVLYYAARSGSDKLLKFLKEDRSVQYNCVGG